MKYQRATDDELRAAGFDPKWIADDDEREGPYAPIRVDTTCGCCGGGVFGWTVVNLETATAVSTEWSHDEAEIEATEHADMLNGAWLAGFSARERAEDETVQ